MYLKTLVILFGLLLVPVEHPPPEEILTQSQIAKQCLHLREAYQIGREQYIDFLIVRKQGEPDRYRLYDQKALNKFLSTVMATHDYVQCLEGGIIQFEVRRKDAI
tara:strand:- start:1489 stop:1803 length:315 start_codon:yes stop_codon:yes gene_type:complete